MILNTEGKAYVFFTKDISPQSIVKIYKKLGKELKGKVGIKIPTGEVGNIYYLKLELIKDIVDLVKGTICECNCNFTGKRVEKEDH